MRFSYLFYALLMVVLPASANHIGHETPDHFNLPVNNSASEAKDHHADYFRCGGYIRAGYIQTNSQSASALGGESGCGYKLNQYVAAHLGLFASWDFGVNSDNDNNIQADLFNQESDSYLIVGEAVLTLNYADFEVFLGRQQLDSPHMDADDLRMIPNLFEAYLFNYHYSDELSLGSGFVREASGWENGGNASQFLSIGKGLGGTTSGAWISWMNYQQEAYTSDVWFYYIPDHLTIFYTEFDFSQVLFDTVSYGLALQYDWGEDVGSADMGEFSAHTLGVTFSVSWLDITLTSAYNKNFGETGATISLGAGPFFTSLEELTLDAVEGEDAQSILLNLEYQMAEEVVAGIAVAEYTAADKKDFNQEELNVYIYYNWPEKFTTELIYAAINDKNGGEAFHQFRAILTYRY